MGDPRHTRSETYHVGTSLDQGLFPRLTKQSCEKFASIWKSYCDYGDTFCDSGINVEAHLLYVTIYGSNAKNFVLDKIGG